MGLTALLLADPEEGPPEEALFCCCGGGGSMTDATGISFAGIVVAAARLFVFREQ